VEEASRLKPRMQEPLFALCMVACLIVERERLDRGVTWNQFKRHLILKGPQISLPALEQVKMAAKFCHPPEARR
jgi:hypothetical protein